MRRRTRTTREFVAGELRPRVNKLMDNRRKLLAPFPLVPAQMYQAAWTSEERAAIRVCARREQLLRTGQYLVVHVPCIIRGDEKVVAVTARLEKALPMSDNRLLIPYENLLPEQSTALREWVPTFMDLRRQQAELEQQVTMVGKVCKTYGQLYRLWPDILSLMDQAGLQKIRNAKVRSAYPYGVEGADGLKPEFQPSAFEPFTAMIAECLMLPMTEGTEVGAVAMV